MDQINENVGKIRHEYMKNRRFVSPGEFKIPPVFELVGYDDETPAAPSQPAAQPSTEPEHQQHNPTPEIPTEDTETGATNPQPAQAEGIENPAPIAEPDPPQPAETKQPRMLARISDELNLSLIHI